MAAFMQLLKQCFFLAAGSNLALRFRLNALRERDFRVILNLHRLEPSGAGKTEALNPVLFEQLLDFLQSEFILSTLAEDARSDARAGKPVAVLSFDDGYKDFIEVAVPILRKRGIRCNQNIIPGCVESGFPPLNVLAQDFLAQAPQDVSRQLEIPGFDMLDQRPGQGRRLSAFLKNRPIAQQEQLATILVPQLQQWPAFRPAPMMNLDEVRQVSREHELGAHSFSHANMALETPAYFVDDIRRCREYFRDRLDLPLTIYAFPNGSYGPGQVEMLTEAGVQHVLLVDEDFDRGSEVHPRFTFHAASASEARFRATGGLRRVPA